MKFFKIRTQGLVTVAMEGSIVAAINYFDKAYGQASDLFKDACWYAERLDTWLRVLRPISGPQVGYGTFVFLVPAQLELLRLGVKEHIADIEKTLSKLTTACVGYADAAASLQAARDFAAMLVNPEEGNPYPSQRCYVAYGKRTDQEDA